MTYQELLLRKVPRAELFGFEPASEPLPGLYPHAQDLARWMVRGGRRACFSAFGLHKTRIHLQVAKWIVEKFPGKKYLFVCPLGVRHNFVNEDGPSLGMRLVYCTSDAEVDAADTPFVLTNYERVREGNITVNDSFVGAGLDESSVLRSYGEQDVSGVHEDF